MHTKVLGLSGENDVLYQQFRLPSGMVGRVAGWFMAWQNRSMNRFALCCLDVRRDDAILEIGFGPGEAIYRLAKNTPATRIVGIDPSEVMLEQARRRNESFIQRGRVSLVQGNVVNLPFESGRFSRVFSVSTFHDWEDRARGLAEIRRVLGGSGFLVLCLRRMPRHWIPWSAPGLSEKDLTEDRSFIAKQGFREVQQIADHLGRSVCLIAKH
jgi:ubiquinone/menaquinone biosynthesis C-methylase UbiE